MAAVKRSGRRDPRGRRVVAVGAAAGVLGFAGCALGLAVDPARTWLAYLMALAAAVSIAVGALVLLMVGYAANSRWMSVIRRLAGAPTLAFPALALLFVPLLFGADLVYPWLAPHADLPPDELETIHHRAGYLNLPFFAGRGAAYFLIWIAAAELLRRATLRRQRAATPAASDPEEALGGERAVSSALLPLVGLAITFAAFDWLMSLHTVWYSTIFGVYVFAGGFVAAIGVVIGVGERARLAGSLAGALRPNHFHALGRLLLAFVVFWAYCAFFQAMLIAIADRPEEVVFYLERTSGAWAVFVYLLVLGHFAVPFFLLLPRRVKFQPRLLAAIGWWIAAMHVVDVYWLAVPARVQGWSVLHWTDLAALAAVFGSAVAVAAWRQSPVSLLPERDPFLDEGIAYRSPL